MTLPTTSELVDSLDNELMDLLSERLKLSALLPAPSSQEEIDSQVQRLRHMATVYRVPPELGEKMALALIEATREIAARKQKGPPGASQCLEGVTFCGQAADESA